MIEELTIAGGLLWALWPRKRKTTADDPQILVLDPTVFPDEPVEPDEPTVLDVFTRFVSEVPRPGAGYQGGAGENLLGTVAQGGIIARALLHPDGLGRLPTANESARYYAAIGRVRSNARLYGTRSNADTPNIERYQILTQAGAQESQTITAARCPWHESWWEATGVGRLPFRRIGFTRTGNKCSGLKRVPGWGGGTRYGVLWLPPVSVLDHPSPLLITAQPSMDWPAELYAAAGTSWNDYTAIPPTQAPGSE